MKNWLKHNESDLPLMAFITTWLILVWLFDPEGKDLVITVIAITIVVIVVKAITAYIKWAAVEEGEFLYKEHLYYVVPSEHEEKLSDNDDRKSSPLPPDKDAQSHFELAINYLTEGDTDSAIREYQIVEGLDKILASRLYEQIFS